MKNEMQIFSDPEFGSVRTLEIDGEPWLVGKDVAEILGYSNPSEAISEHIEQEDKLNSKTLSSFELNLGQRGGWLINESGLYSLVLSSKLPSAKKFKHRVTSEVLPSIRKHGMYAEDELLDNPDLIIKVAQALKEEREKNKALTEKGGRRRWVTKCYILPGGFSQKWEQPPIAQPLLKSMLVG